MANSQLALKLLLVTMTIVVGSVFAEDLQCAQCVSGNFLHRQWLMQHSEVGQSMGWVHQWQGTNCATGNLRVIICFSSCITITLRRNSSMGYVDDGLMMDCADDLIHASPDLPAGIDFRNYKGNDIYHNIRYGFNITYEFSLVGFKSQTRVVQEIATLQLPKSVPTNEDHLGIVLVIGGCAFILCLAFVFWSCSGENRFPGVRAARDVANDIERRPKEQISSKSEDKSVAPDQPLLENSEVNKDISD